MSQDKVYLGDGVYADWDGYQIKLTVENGITTTDTIYIDNEVIKKLIEYAERKGML